MFLHADDGHPGPLAIHQTCHAWMAWQLAAHWGNRRFPRPSPRADVLAAAFVHDAGWTGFDPDPGVDANGRPLTFDHMPVRAHLEIWDTCVDRAAQISRYAALLVASHADRLAGRKEEEVGRGDLELLESIRAWRKGIADRRTAWQEELATDPRYSPALAGPRWEANGALVAACDAVSVHLCAGIPGAFSVEAAGPSLDVREITFEPIGDRVWKVRPWPLQGRRLDLHCEGRRLETETFASGAELREVLSQAPVERLSFSLVSPSVAATG
jgi:hypothetical protein